MPVFDGHDLLLRLWRAGPRNVERPWIEGDGAGHLNLLRRRRGGFAGGLFAIYVPAGGPGGHACTTAPPTPSRRGPG